MAFNSPLPIPKSANTSKVTVDVMVAHKAYLSVPKWFTISRTETNIASSEVARAKHELTAVNVIRRYRSRDRPLWVDLSTEVSRSLMLIAFARLSIELFSSVQRREAHGAGSEQSLFRGTNTQNAAIQKRRDNDVLHRTVRPRGKRQGHNKLCDGKGECKLRESKQHSYLVLSLAFQPAKQSEMEPKISEQSKQTIQEPDMHDGLVYAPRFGLPSHNAKCFIRHSNTDACDRVLLSVFERTRNVLQGAKLGAGE